MTLWLILRRLYQATPSWARRLALWSILMSGAYVLGILHAGRQARREAQALAQAAEGHRQAAADAVRQATALEGQLTQAKQQLVNADRALKHAQDLTGRAQMNAEPALRPLPSIPDGELRDDLGRAQVLIQALTNENAQLRAHDALETKRADLAEAYAASYKRAYQEESLRAIALQGQLVAQAQAHHAEVLGIKIKYGLGGGAVGAGIGWLLGHKR